jgi:hypothetical protein
MENSVVRVRDDAHSTYITRNPRLEREDQKIKSVIWEAIDEKGREVSIMVIEHRDTGRWSIAVLYPGYMIQYFIVKELE